MCVGVCAGLGVAFKCCLGLAKGACNDARTVIALTLFACGRSCLSAGGCVYSCVFSACDFCTDLRLIEFSACRCSGALCLCFVFGAAQFAWGGTIKMPNSFSDRGNREEGKQMEE